MLILYFVWGHTDDPSAPTPPIGTGLIRHSASLRSLPTRKHHLKIASLGFIGSF